MPPDIIWVIRLDQAVALCILPEGLIKLLFDMLRILAIIERFIKNLCGRGRIRNLIPSRLVQATGKSFDQLDESLELLIRGVCHQSPLHISQSLLIGLRKASKPFKKRKVLGGLCSWPLQGPISTIASSGSAKLNYVRRKLVRPPLGVSLSCS